MVRRLGPGSFIWEMSVTMTAESRLSMPVGEAIFTQRAIRRLKPDPIPESDLRDVLEAATRAPSGGNSQPWHFVVVRDAKLRA